MKNTSLNNLIISIFLVIFSIIAFAILWYFYKLIFLAGILAILFLPIHEYLLKHLKSDILAASLTVTIILVIVVVPLYFITQVAITETVNFYTQYKEGGLHISQQIVVNHLPQAWQQASVNIISNASEKVRYWAKSFTLDIEGIVSNIAGFFFLFFVLFFAIFYFLKDHHHLKKYMDDLFHLPAVREDALINKIIAAVNGVVKGNLLVAVINGIVAFAGYLAVGLPQPLFWGAATIVSAFVPAVGTSLVMIPAAIYLFLFKSFSSAVILAVWYMAMHLILDNIVGPKLISSKMQMHPLLALLSILGGIELFGPLGFLFGPIVMSILLVLVEDYKIHWQSGQ